MNNQSYDPDEDIEEGRHDDRSNHGDNDVASDYGTSSLDKVPEKVEAMAPYAGMGKDDLLRFSQTPFWRNLRTACLVIFWLAWLGLLAAVIALTVVLPRCKAQPEQEWWQKDSLYQIYVRSFYDSDADGVGDLKGVEAKLDFLYDVNAHGLVLSSFYQSQAGERDYGYEVTDHKAVDPQYGTMQDFEDLLTMAHSKGLKIIIDFIPNYTGKNHDWFQQSSADFNRSGDHWNYYIWTPCREDRLPNNWLTVYGDPAWTFVAERAECYLHQFMTSQPDLNLRSDAVKRELESVLRFWLEKGVDGFRVNAPAYLFEDSEQTDEVPVPGCTDSNEYNCFLHQQTRNRPEVYDLVHRWRAILDEYGPDKVLLTDAYESINVTKDYYGLYGGRGADLPINYQLDRMTSDCDGECVRELVTDWLDLVPSAATATWALGGQDLSRAVSDLGRKRAELKTMLAFTLPGVPVTYYGEDLGMRNGAVTAGGSLDPAGDTDVALSRDPYRTPMQWENATYAGFMNLTRWEEEGQTSSPWLPVSDDYDVINVKTQTSLLTSQLSLYSKLARMRTVEPALYLGDHVPAFTNDQVFSFVREFDGIDSLLVALNFGNTTFRGNLKSANENIPDQATVYLSNSEGASLTSGSGVNLRDVTLRPAEGVIFVWAYSR